MLLIFYKYKHYPGLIHLNKLSRLAILTTLMPFCLHAQSDTATLTTGLSQESVDSSTARKYEVSAGYIARDLQIDSSLTDEKISGKGASLSAGKIFNLSNGFTATSSLVGTYLTLDNNEDNIDDNIDQDFLNYEVGYYQKFGYNISMGSTVVKPFIELNYSVGTYDATSEFEGNDLASATEVNLKRNYSNYGIAGGLQVTFKNGLSPFVKYNISKLQFSRNGQSEITVEGQTNTSNNLVLNREQRRNTTTAVTAGFGYLF